MNFLIKLICIDLIFCSINNNQFTCQIGSNKLEKIILENGLEVLFIQNEKFKKSTVQICVDAGSIYNPPKALGLAHLLEHAIYLGSYKYPKKNELSNFVERRLGFKNARTSEESVNFYFQIPDSHILKASEILADSISNPLLIKEDCENEIKIVDFEFKEKINDSVRRANALHSLMLDSSVPEHYFSSGNLKSLSIPDIHLLLRDFHKKHYTANRMKLVIASKLSRDELLKVANLFKIIPKSDKKVISLLSQTPKFKVTDKFYKAVTKFHTEIEESNLRIKITIPNEIGYKAYQTLIYVNKLFIHDCPFISFLKRRNFIKKLLIGTIQSSRSLSISLYFVLIENRTQIIDFIIQSLNFFIKKHVPNKNLFDFETEKNNRELLSSLEDDFDAAQFYSEMFFYFLFIKSKNLLKILNLILIL